MKRETMKRETLTLNTKINKSSIWTPEEQIKIRSLMKQFERERG